MRKLELTDSEQQAFWQKIARDYPLQEGLKEQLASDQGLEDSLLVAKYKYEKIKEVAVTEDEIKAYYQEHKKDFLVPERVMVSHILVSSSDLAVELQQKLGKADETAFRQAARNYSEAPDAYKGGLMGVLSPETCLMTWKKWSLAWKRAKYPRSFNPLWLSYLSTG